MKIYRSIALITLAICLCVTPTRAQTEQDRIIVGEHLASLWTAINRGVVKVSNDELKSQISKFQLSAILIPKQQAGSQYVVRRCFNIKTAFDEPDLKITPSDYEQLLKYATNVVFQKAFTIKKSLRNGDRSAVERESAEMLVELNRHPEADRAAERVFVGSVLAEVEPTQTVLTAYVKEFRKTVEDGLLSELVSAPLIGDLSPGEPYVVGSSTFTVADLGKVNPARVEQVKLNNRNYRKVWLGSTLIIVPQTIETSTLWADPTGLGLSANWVASSNTMTAGSKMLTALQVR